VNKEVVVIGGGIGGLEVALKAERKGFKVKLIDPGEEMLFYPSAHRILEGEDSRSFSINYGKKFSDRKIEHIKEKAHDIDFEAKKVRTGGQDVKYGYLVIAAGSETQFYGIEGKERANTMRFKEDAQEIHQEISQDGHSSIAVVGGGATGVEATASLLELRKRKDFDINLVHGSERLLPANSERLAEKVENSLRSKGVKLFLESKAVEITGESVELDEGSKIPAEIVLWAGGVRPNGFIEKLDIEKNEKGIEVDEHMLTSRENVFAVGDIADYVGKENRALHAVFEAKAVAKNLNKKRKGKNLVERKIRWDPQLIYLGENDSALEIRGHFMRGRIPSLIRSLGVEKRYLWTRKYLL
jgi:NADH dehydrogenase